MAAKDKPETVTQTADNTSTGAVKFEAPGTTEVSHYTEDVVVNYETPGPVTVTVSWLDKAQAKVVTASEDDTPIFNATEAETK